MAEADHVINITPHTGGGHADETLRIVKHFVHNLHRSDSLLDRVF